MDSFPEELMEPTETNNDCSLDLSPNPDSGLFGNQEVSEEESSSAESENDSQKEDGSDASSRDPVEPEEVDNWTPVTSRRQGAERVPSRSPLQSGGASTSSSSPPRRVSHRPTSDANPPALLPPCCAPWPETSLSSSSLKCYDH